MFFDGCPTDLGCTVTLRGGNSFILSKVKRIFQHMVYVAYSLKLELCFLMDEFALPPDTTHMIKENEIAVEKFEEMMNESEPKLKTKEHKEETMVSEEQAGVLGQDSDERTEIFLAALKSTMLSSSPFLDYPLPYLLTEAGRNFDLRSALPADIYWSARIDTERNQHHLTEDDLEQFEFSNPHQRHHSKFVCFVEPHPLVSASLTMDHKDPLFQALLSDFRAQGGQIQLTKNVKTQCRGQRRLIKGMTFSHIESSQSNEDKTSSQETKDVKMSEEYKETKKPQKKLSSTTNSVHVTHKVTRSLIKI